MSLNLALQSDKIILALGPESSGNFSLFAEGKIHLSQQFGDLLEDNNFLHFKSALAACIAVDRFKPDIILTDLHPSYVTTAYGQELASKFEAEIAPIQHHLAHVCSAIGDQLIDGGKLPNAFIGIAADGTGYGLDGMIWGGEIFEFRSHGSKYAARRIGHLENQILIGGDLAIREPARMLIGIFQKILGRDEAYEVVKDYYPRKTYDLLTNQLEQNFNCFETSSTGRILDAVSVLLGFASNARKYKHEPIDLLENNSTSPFELEPRFIERDGQWELLTTPLFEYLASNMDKDKSRLAATAQAYLAEGFVKIAQRCGQDLPAYFAGGMANNRIISERLTHHGVYLNKKIPRGDAGISFGQIVYYLLTDSGNQLSSR